MRGNYWQDWVNLFIAGWLFITPWFYDYVALPGAAWNAWIVGVLAAVVALAALAQFAAWQQYAIIVLGAWLVISPWIVGGMMIQPVLWNFVLVGVLFVVFAAWNLTQHRARPVPPA